SVTDAQQIAVIDADSLAVIAMVPSKGYPDRLAFAPEAGRVYGSDENDGNERTIDAKANARLDDGEVGWTDGNTQDAPGARLIVRYGAAENGPLSSSAPTTAEFSASRSSQPARTRIP